MSRADVQRLGLLGGTFDPPHYGHLWLAEAARDQLVLDTVYFLPAGQPPHKHDPVTQAQHRLAMTEAAIAGQPHFAIDRTDLDRPPPHYTSTLLTHLNERWPQSQLFLLLGGDSLRDLPDWHSPRTLLSLCELVVLDRPGVQYDWAQLEAAIPGIRDRTRLLNGPQLAIASRQLRTWAADGRSWRFLAPSAVIDYATAEGLYPSG